MTGRSGVPLQRVGINSCQGDVYRLLLVKLHAAASCSEMLERRGTIGGAEVVFELTTF